MLRLTRQTYGPQRSQQDPLDHDVRVDVRRIIGHFGRRMRFVALFGRDSLVAFLQTTLVYSDFARGSLDVLGAWQAERDDYRDAEPGEIMHELRLGDLS